MRRPSRPTVLLFDVDGTLVSTGGAGRRAMERAFVETRGDADTLTFSFGGMTDRAIARRGLDDGLRPVSEAEIDRLLASYLVHLADEVPRSANFVVHDGVTALLALAAASEGVALGLGTGNVREGARLKLGHAGLFEKFSFGGFGCDDEDRAALLAVGRDRGVAALGAPRGACRVIVLGDTPRDVAAARAIGAEIVAVATGGTSAPSLQACAPDLLVDTLAHPAVHGFLLG